MNAENSHSAIARRRGPGRPFAKGVSGNPGGLARDIAPLVAEARRLALSHATRAIATLAELLDDKDPRVRVAAAEGLLDRAGLRPYALEPERVEVTHSVDVDALRAALALRVEALVAARSAEALSPSGTDHLLPEQAGADSQPDSGTLEGRGASRGAFEGSPPTPPANAAPAGKEGPP